MPKYKSPLATVLLILSLVPLGPAMASTAGSVVPDICGSKVPQISEDQILVEHTLYFHGSNRLGDVDGAGNTPLGTQFLMDPYPPMGAVTKYKTSKPGMLGNDTFGRNATNGYWLRELESSQRIVCAGAKFYAVSASDSIDTILYFDKPYADMAVPSVSRVSATAPAGTGVRQFNVTFSVGNELGTMAQRDISIQFAPAAPGAMLAYDSYEAPASLTYVTIEPKTTGKNEVTQFVFAPSDFTGTLAARLWFEWEGDNVCSVTMGAAGPRGLVNPVHYWADWRSAKTSAWASLSEVYNLQAHAAGQIDARSLTSSSGNWAMWHTVSGTFTRFLELTFRGFDLKTWNKDGVTFLPVRIELTCERPFSVAGLSAGRNGRSFTRDSLEGGVGASAQVVQPSATVSVGDELRHTFDESTTLFNLRSLQPLSVGRLTLEHPEGTEAWSSPWSTPIVEEGETAIEFEGSPGAYRMTLDRVGAFGDLFVGSLVGLDPVECLEQAIGLECEEIAG